MNDPAKHYLYLNTMIRGINEGLIGLGPNSHEFKEAMKMVLGEDFRGVRVLEIFKQMINRLDERYTCFVGYETAVEASKKMGLDFEEIREWVSLVNGSF